MRSSTKTCRNACQLYGRHVKINLLNWRCSFLVCKFLLFLYNRWIHMKAYINFPTLLIKTNVFFWNLRAVTKILFLPVMKRALTSLSFMVGLRNGHEVEAARWIDFKFDYFLTYTLIYVHIHTYHYLISQLKLFKFWSTNWEACILRKKSVSFFIWIQKCQPHWKSPVKLWWWI